MKWKEGILSALSMEKLSDSLSNGLNLIPCFKLFGASEEYYTIYYILK